MGLEMATMSDCLLLAKPEFEIENHCVWIRYCIINFVLAWFHSIQMILLAGETAINYVCYIFTVYLLNHVIIVLFLNMMPAIGEKETWPNM